MLVLPMPVREALSRQSSAEPCLAGYCDGQQGSLLVANQRDRLRGAPGSTEHTASGPHGSGSTQ